MTRGRTSTTISASDKPQIDEQLAAADVQQAVQLATLQQGYGQGRDLVNQLLGQAQAFQAAGDLLRTFGVSKLAIVKENKLYQQLGGKRAIKQAPGINRPQRKLGNDSTDECQPAGTLII